MESANITTKDNHVARNASMEIVIKKGTMKLGNKMLKASMTTKKVNTIKNGIRIKKEKNNGNKKRVKKPNSPNKL